MKVTKLSIRKSRNQSPNDYNVLAAKLNQIIDHFDLDSNVVQNYTDSLPKRYTAKITQTSTNNPAALIVYENTTGGNITFIRYGEGQYYVKSSNNAFTVGKTVFNLINGMTPVHSVTGEYGDPGFLVFNSRRNDNITSDGDDGQLVNAIVDITIYP